MSSSIETECRIGPLGGIDQLVPFAPYDAIDREAVVSSSPFYRVLCAFRIYDGTTEIRRWLRGQCEQHRIADRMPAHPEVTAGELLELGFAPEAVNGVRRARDLFERFRDHRNSIAHFLVEGEQGQAHVYLADGVMIRTCSVGAAGLLKYAHQTPARASHVLHGASRTNLDAGHGSAFTGTKGSLCCA